MRSQAITVRIDLDRLRHNAAQIRKLTNVDELAVVKADGYGLGGARVAAAVADVVQGFYVFDLDEAVAYELPRFGKPIVALLGESNDADDYASRHVRPVVWTAERAAALKRARPVLSVDTGQQRFAAPAEQLADVARAGDCREAMSHSSTPAQAQQFADLTNSIASIDRRHAAGTALLNEPSAWFDAVRPGLALYRGATRVSGRLVEARDTRGPAGYGGFAAARHGVILGGYCNGVRPGPCLVNGRRSRLLEVGMQTSFVELAPTDKVGDEVVLLGDGLTEQDVALAWHASPQNVLLTLCAAGERSYVGGRA